MANGTFDLDSILEQSDAEYGSTKIPVGDVVVQLRNVIRLSKEERKSFQDLLPTSEKKEGEEGEDEVDTEALLDGLPKMIKLLAEDAAAADVLLEKVGNKPDVLMIIFKNYMEDQKSGKASDSES